MLFTHLNSQQNLVFAGAASVLIASIIAFHSDKSRLALILLWIGGIGLGCFISVLDPFLLLWDEQYHALVAKNMLKHPFTPTLYRQPVLPYDITNWTMNHVWLHKQPLFLWQIALSLKLFGINELAVRIPSILMHALIPLMIYRIGKISYRTNAGFYGALFFTVASYPLELVAGRHATDHNDIAFLFYFTGSFWAWYEYQRSPRISWILCIGLMAGCAVMVKWLTGLMVFGIWMLVLGADDKKNWLRLKSYGPILTAFIFSFMVFLPWQLYIFYQFPVEAAHEFHFNTHHFFQALEDHSGDLWFHLRAVKDIYGSWLIIPFLIGGIVLLAKKARSKMMGAVPILAIIITYGFFSVAATKMVSFCILASPFVWLGFGVLTNDIFSYLYNQISRSVIVPFMQAILLILICIFIIDLPLIEDFHTRPNPTDHCGRAEELSQMGIVESVKKNLNDGLYVVFNASARPNGYIETMFYTDVVAYEFIPDTQQIRMARQQGYKTAIVMKDSLPEYLRIDTAMIKLYYSQSK